MRAPLFHALRRAIGRTSHAPASRSARPCATRRALLAGAGAATLAGFAGLSPLAAAPEGAPRIAVVGAGLAGLVATHHLRRAGLAVTLYEARHHVGGRISSAAVLGSAEMHDLGGHFIAGDHADMLALTRDFDLELRDVSAAADAAAHEVDFFFQGRRVPQAEMAAAIRPFALRLAEDQARLACGEGAAEEIDALSVTAYLDRHPDALAPLARALVEAAARVQFGAEPDACSALQLLHALRTGGADEAAFVIRGGSSRLPAALAAGLGDALRTNHALTVLTRQGATYRLRFANGAVAEADAVLLTLPFPVLRRVQLGLALPPTLARFIAEAELGQAEKVLLRLRRMPAGFARAWSDAGFSTAWRLAGDQPALAFVLGGRQVTREPAEAAAARFLATLARDGGPALAATGQVVRTAWGDEPFTRGAFAAFRPGQLTDFADHLWTEEEDGTPAQQVRAGRVFFAGEQLSEAYPGTMNGAAQTGRLAAGGILRTLRGIPRDAAA